MDIEGLKINYQYFSLSELKEFVEKQVYSNRLDEWERIVYVFLNEFLDDRDFILQKTSGSTGIPREIKLMKKAMIASAVKTIQFLNLKEDDNALLCLPAEYIAAKMMIVRALTGKLNLILTEPRGTITIPANTKIDFTAMVPVQVQKLLEENYTFENINKLIIGGAGVNSYIEKEIQHLETEVFETYGMAETSSHIALRRVNSNNKQIGFRVMDGIHIEKNTSGCLIIHAPHLSSNPVITSDLVEIMSEREFVWLGRADNVINSGGIKIYPEKLESEIERVIQKECALIPIIDELLGQKPVLCLETNEPVDKEYIIDIVRKKFGKYYLPKDIVCYDEFPRNASLKIDREALIREVNRNKPKLNKQK